MSNITEYVTRDEFDKEISQLIIGLSVVGVVLLIVIVLGAIAICFLVIKLRELYNASNVELSSKTFDEHINIEMGNGHARNRLRDRSAYLSCRENEGPRPHSGESSNSRTHMHPVLELEIKKEVVNLYGHRPPIGQVMMAAQDYYKVQTKTQDDCPAESVQIVDTKTKKEFPRSTIFSEDWMEGTPTSLLLRGSVQRLEDAFSHNKGIFVHRTVGPAGGQLFISGVRLKIPKGALSESTLITLGITWDEELMPQLSKKQALLSPVVLCQPSGLRFNVPVTLSFPHAADKMLEDWIPKIKKREGELNDDGTWADISLTDYDERRVLATRIELKLHHFTLYTCAGESKPGKMAAKLVHIVAFAGKLTRNAFFKPRLYCLNSYPDELSDVENLEERLDPSSRMSETTDLLVKDNEMDIIVKLAKLSEEWKLAGEKHETLSFELVWHACRPHCSFVMKPKKTSVPEIECEFHAYQLENENNPAKLKIAEQTSAPSSPLSSADDDPQEKLINELIILLDPQTLASSEAGDWRSLAEKMGCGLARIRWLGTNHSPTKVLLDKWLEDNKSFEELEKLMIEIGRPDVAEEIQKHIPSIKDASVS